MSGRVNIEILKVYPLNKQKFGGGGGGVQTQERPKKNNEAGPPEQLPTDALLKIDYGHTENL